MSEVKENDLGTSAAKEANDVEKGAGIFAASRRLSALEHRNAVVQQPYDADAVAFVQLFFRRRYNRKESCSFDPWTLGFGACCSPKHLEVRPPLVSTQSSVRPSADFLHFSRPRNSGE